MKCVVLGADGFLGSYITEELLKKNYEVVAFDRFYNGRAKNLNANKSGLNMYSGDFLNKADLNNAVANVDAVFHFISMSTPASTAQDPWLDIETNVKATINLLDICVKNKVKQIIFASSGGTIYGDQGKEKYSEFDLTLPISPYGISKLIIERYLHYYQINHNLDYLSLRFSNPYGPRQNIEGSQGVVPIFLNRILNNLPIKIFGSGENVRDYLYIDDLVNLVMRLFEDKKIINQVVNVGSGKGTTVNQIVQTIESVTGKRFVIEKMPARNCDIKEVVLDNSLLLNKINDYTFVDLETGIKNTWQYLKKS